jgi:peptidoglycan/LPS O-acetylase OafA/YrhL
LNTLSNKLTYIEGLDGIRALAALMVVLAHWPGYALSVKFGWIGVNIFFVLSGFLITRILVNNKHQTLKAYLGDFFYKRALRIFPVYYLFIALTGIIILALFYGMPRFATDDILLSGVGSIKHDWPYYLTYTYNLKLNFGRLFRIENFNSKFLGHLWSLSVEEQFYLIFPFIVYFSNVATLKKVVIGIIVICPLIRLWAAIYGVNLVSNRFWLGETLYTNTLCQADALAMGACLALFKFKINHPYRTFSIAFIGWLVPGVICLYYLRQSGYFLVEGKSLGYNFPGFWFEQLTPYFLVNIRPFYQYTLVNVLAFALIAPAVSGKPLFPRVFKASWVSYLGKISYGIYLFHGPLIALLMLGLTFFGNLYTILANPIVHISIFLVYLAILISIAHLSYKYFEQKILKRYKNGFAKY